jgi:hypothetical protein
MFGAIVIKANDRTEAENKYGEKAVLDLFEMLSGQHPDSIKNQLEGDTRDCFYILFRNYYSGETNT